MVTIGGFCFVLEISYKHPLASLACRSMVPFDRINIFIDYTSSSERVAYSCSDDFSLLDDGSASSADTVVLRDNYAFDDDNGSILPILNYESSNGN